MFRSRRLNVADANTRSNHTLHLLARAHLHIHVVDVETGDIANRDTANPVPLFSLFHFFKSWNNRAATT